jgi:serine/threonine protein phosphatase PrpC
LYAQLTQDKYDNFLEDVSIPFEEVSPLEILMKAYNMTQHDAHKQGILGSTTALITILRGDELRICNLGDCGVMVIRHGEPIFRS